MRTRAVGLAAAFVAAFSLAVACSSGSVPLAPLAPVPLPDATPGGPDGPAASADSATNPDADGGSGSVLAPTMIGPAGGTLASPDGSAVLVIPPGALKRAVALSIAPVSPAPPGAVGTAFDIEPSGTTFDPPAILTLSLDPKLDSAALGRVVMATAAGGGWLPLGNASIGAVSHDIRAPISHLSIYAAVFGDNLPDPCECNASVWSSCCVASGGANHAAPAGTCSCALPAVTLVTPSDAQRVADVSWSFADCYEQKAGKTRFPGCSPTQLKCIRDHHGYVGYDAAPSECVAIYVSGVDADRIEGDACVRAATDPPAACCGRAAETCCSEARCYPKLGCGAGAGDGGTCTACGGFGEPCCSADNADPPCPGGGACDPTKNAPVGLCPDVDGDYAGSWTEGTYTGSVAMTLFRCGSWLTGKSSATLPVPPCSASSMNGNFVTKLTGSQVQGTFLTGQVGDTTNLSTSATVGAGQAAALTGTLSGAVSSCTGTVAGHFTATRGAVRVPPALCIGGDWQGTYTNGAVTGGISFRMAQTAENAGVGIVTFAGAGCLGEWSANVTWSVANGAVSGIGITGKLPSGQAVTGSGSAKGTSQALTGAFSTSAGGCGNGTFTVQHAP